MGVIEVLKRTGGRPCRAMIVQARLGGGRDTDAVRSNVSWRSTAPAQPCALGAYALSSVSGSGERPSTSVMP
jgi:hypothetical protein